MLWIVMLLTAADATSPSLAGSYGVGVATWNLTDASRQDRRLPTEVWYPTQDRSHGVEPTRDAPCAPGRFPLIVFSHGSKATRVQSSYLTTQIGRAHV